MDKFIIVAEYPEGMQDIPREIYEYLKTKGNCLQLTYHSFMLAAEVTAVELRDTIKGVSDKVESVFVSKMTLPAAWSNSLSESSDIKVLFHE